jgi:hypothetical protein
LKCRYDIFNKSKIKNGSLLWRRALLQITKNNSNLIVVQWLE